MMAATVALGAGPAARAQDDALRALGLGLSIINNMQQQQIQQRQQQPQATQPRQQRSQPAAKQPPRQVDTAAARREREAVKNVQALLNRLGYDAGPVDGDPGRRTQTAIAAFRADYGLEPGGRIDAELLGALRVAGRSAPAVASGGERTQASARRQQPVAVDPPLWDEPEPDAASIVAMEDGSVMVDGRLAAASNGKFDYVGKELDYMAMGASVERAVFRHTMALTPGAFDDDEVALSAVGLVEPALARSLLEEAFGRSLTKQEANAVVRGLAARDIVQGLDPFEEQDLIAVVRANQDRIVPPDLVEAPVPLRVYCQVRLGKYDFESQSFPIYEGCNGRVRGAAELIPDGPEPTPDRLPMTPEEARTFPLARPGTHSLASFDAELNFEQGGDALSGPTLEVSLTRLPGSRLYAPGSMTDVVYQIGGPETTDVREGVAMGGDGVMRIDGRMLATSTDQFGSFGVDVDGAALGRSLSDLIFAYNLSLRPDALDDDEAALTALEMIDPALAAEIFVEALGRPLTDEERQQYSYRSFRMLNGFEQLRAFEGLRARRGQLVPADLPDPPVQLRVLCTLSLERYDFEAQGFPVSWSNGCDEGTSGSPVGIAGLGKVQGAGRRPVPEIIPVPQDQAEAMGDGGQFLASYDALLDFKVRRTEAGSQLGVQLTDRGGLRIHPYGSLTEVLYRQEDTPTSATAKAEATVSEPWVLWDEADQAEMAALAGVPNAFPANGAALIAAGSETLGIIEDNARIRTDDDGRVWPADLFDTYHAAERLRLATALSVPLDYVVELRGPTSGQGLGGIYGLLPAPAANYGAMPPDDLYGEPDVRYRWTAAVTGLHAFELPGGAVMLAVLKPMEGRFITTDDRDPKVLERFDLGALVPPPEVELIAPESLATIVLATTGDADPVATLVEKMDTRTDVFDRTDLAERLVQEEEDRGGPPDAFWVAGEMRLGEYDMKGGAFPATSVQIGPIDVLRRDDLPGWAFPSLRIEGDEFALRMDEEQARAWAREHSEEHAVYRFRGRIGVENPDPKRGIVGHLLEAEILAPDAVATRRDPDGVLWRYVIAPPAVDQVAAAAAPSQPASETAAPPAAQAKGVSRDVLGITLGTPLGEAEATLAAELGETTEFTLTRDQFSQKVGMPEVKAWGSYATGTLHYDPAKRLSVALFSEPPAAADRVTAVLRTQTFVDAGRPHPDAIVGILQEKYGAPSRDRSDLGYARILLWNDGPPYEEGVSGCQYEFGDEARTAAINLHNTARGMRASPGAFPSFWRGSDGAAWADEDSLTLNLREAFVKLGECAELGEVLMALVMTDPDGLVRSLQVALANPSEAAGLVELNEAAAQEAAPTAENGLDIKL